MGLEEQLPYLFMCSAKEALQGPRRLRIELPHVGGPALAREDAAEDHDLHHIGETNIFPQHVGDALLQHLHLRLGPPIEALSGP